MILVSENILLIEFNRFNILSKQKLAKKCKCRCRVRNQSLIGDETLKVNEIIPKSLGGKDVYNNFELLHLLRIKWER